MKRPFALIGITYLSVQAALFYLQSDIITLVVAVSGFLGAVFSLFVFKKRNLSQTALGFCITAAFASVIFSGYNTFIKQPVIDKYSDKEIYVKAVISEMPVKENDLYRYLLETESINGKNEKVKIALTTISRIDADEFDKISCNLPVSECTVQQRLADGVFLQSAIYNSFDYSVEKTKNKPFYYYAIKARKSLSDSLEQILPEDCASLCRAVLLGEKSALSQEMRNDFTWCGVSFLIVVSGMHLAIICSFVYFCINKVVKSRVLRSVIMLFSVFLFMAVTGFSPSVVRAGVMLAVVYSGRMFMRKGDSLNSLGIAALILTVPNPMAVADVGMLLSFTATLGIILWAKPITDYVMNRISRLNRLKKPLEFVVNLFAVSVSASIWTMPFSVLMFGRFSVFSILLSMLLSPVVSALVAFSLLTVIFYSTGLLSFLAYPFGLICGVLGRFVNMTVAAFSDIPFSSVNARKPYFYIWLALCIALVIAGCFVRNKASYAVKGALVSFCVLILGFGIYTVIDVNSTVLNVYATGGNTVMIRRGRNCSVISCGGKAYSIYSAVSEIMEDTTVLDFVIVPSEKKTDTLYADIFQRKFDESDVLIYDSKGENKDFGCRKYFSANKSFTVNINSNTKDEVVSSDSGVYQYITANNTTVLLLNSKCKAEDILEKHRKADYIITDKAGENLKSLSGKNVILTADCDGIITSECNNIIIVQDEKISIVLD